MPHSMIIECAWENCETIHVFVPCRKGFRQGCSIHSLNSELRDVCVVDTLHEL